MTFVIGTSPDGVTWTKRNTQWDAATAIALAVVETSKYNSTSIAIGVGVVLSSYTVVSRSTDGIHWTAITTPLDSAGEVTDIATNDAGTWVVCVDNGVDFNVMTSTDDGLTWTITISASSGGTDIQSFVVWDGSHFIAVDESGNGTSPIWNSTDGVTWNYLGIITTNAVGSLSLGQRATDGAGTVVTSSFGFGNQLEVTTDHGNTWTSITVPPPSGYTFTIQQGGLGWNGSLWITMSDIENTGTSDNSLCILTTPDLATWTQQPSPTEWVGLPPLLVSVSSPGTAWSPSLSYWCSVIQSSSGTPDWSMISNSASTVWTSNVTAVQELPESVVWNATLGLFICGCLVFESSPPPPTVHPIFRVAKRRDNLIGGGRVQPASNTKQASHRIGFASTTY